MNEKPDYLGHRERLRKRFLEGGGKAMPDYEFLELLLTIAIPRRDVKPLAKALIHKFGNFAGVVHAPLGELLAFDGLKETSAAVLKIIKEGAIRMSWQTLKNSTETVIASWDAMMDYCRMVMAHNEVEEFRVLFLDGKYKLIDEEIQNRGTVDQVAVHPREVMRSAINRGAKAIVLVHNHPSGDVKPSKADIEITRLIAKSAADLDINLVDHVIISKEESYSFSAYGLL